MTPEKWQRLQELEDRKARTHGQSVLSIPEPESEEFRMGRRLPPFVRGASKFLEGASLGVYPTVLPPKMEDIMRGGSKQFSEDYPKTSFAFDVLSSTVPSIVSGGTSAMVRPAVTAATALRAWGWPWCLKAARCFPT